MPGGTKPILLFDLLSVAYRWYFAKKTSPMSHKGLNTAPLHGVVQTILLQCMKYDTDDVVVCTDTKGIKTFRHELYPEYKQNRRTTEPDLVESLKHLLPMLDVLGLPVIGSQTHEADDVIGTYVQQAKELDRPCLVFTADKDIVQLVDDSTYVVRWENDGTLLPWTPRIVTQRYGFRRPDMLADMLAIEGDTSDNYRGIPGVGPEKARRWVRRFGTLDDIWAMREHMSDKEREKLEEGIEDARLCKKVSEIVRDVADVPPLESLIPWRREDVDVVRDYLVDHYAMKQCARYYEGHVPKNLDGKGEDYCPPVVPPRPTATPDKAEEGYLF